MYTKANFAWMGNQKRDDITTILEIIEEDSFETENQGAVTDVTEITEENSSSTEKQDGNAKNSTGIIVVIALVVVIAVIIIFVFVNKRKALKK